MSLLSPYAQLERIAANPPDAQPSRRRSFRLVKNSTSSRVLAYMRSHLEPRTAPQICTALEADVPQSVYSAIERLVAHDLLFRAGSFHSGRKHILLFTAKRPEATED